MDALTSLIQEDATQSMPPFDLWLRGRDDILAWWFGPGIGCRGSRVVPTVSANGSPAYGQYKPSATGDGYDPWALQVIEIVGRPDRRVHVLPRHRDALPALRLARPARGLGLVRQDVAQAHEGDECEQFVRRVAQPDLAAAPPRGELEPRERVDRHRVGARRRRRRTARRRPRFAPATRRPASQSPGRSARAIGPGDGEGDRMRS